MFKQSLRTHFAFAALATLSCGTAIAQSRIPTTYDADPFAVHNKAVQVQSQDTRATEVLRRSLGLLAGMGLDGRNSLTVVNADVDDLAALHVRMRQTFSGVRVRGGTLIAHRLRDGSYESDTDVLQRGINLSVTPALSADRAAAVVAAQPGQVAPLAWSPVSELQILPSQVLLDNASGRPATAQYTDHSSEYALPDYNAATATRTVVGYRLVWSVKTLEGVEGTSAPQRGLESLVDAQTGALLSQISLSDSGTGKGPFAGFVSDLQTYQDWNGTFHMLDQLRQYQTWDQPFGTGGGGSVSSTDFWGDGFLFPQNGGTTGTVLDRQSALVDVHQFGRVQWDLLNNVFHRPGPDGNFYSVNQWAHDASSNGNALYNSWSGNCAFGDGNNMQSVAVVSHEHGHALQDFTAGLGTDFDESIADIYGVMGRVYLESGSFANSASTLPTNLAPATGPSSDPWVGTGARRDMVKPSRGPSKASDFYFPGIENQEVHNRAEPSNRAFYFFAQGASPWMDQPDYSPLLPWGMTGVGFATAANLYLRTLLHFLDDGADYNGGRAAFITAAKHRFGASSSQANAARNAWAGINVGNTAPNYLASPQTINSSTINNTAATEQILTVPNNPLRPFGAPDKLQILITDNNPHFFAFQLPAGTHYVVRLQPMIITSILSFQVFDGVAQPSQTVGANFKVQALNASGPSGTTTTIQVATSTTSGFGLYTLALDFGI